MTVSKSFCLVIFFFLAVNHNIYGQESRRVHAAKALASLRVFYDNVNKSAKSPQRDSLAIRVTNLIQTTKTDTNYRNLTFLTAYFDGANQSLVDDAAGNGKGIVPFINADLDLKLKQKADSSKYAFQYEKLFDDKDIMVNVTIAGSKPLKDTFTLYWFNFDGSKREPLILKEVFTQASKQFKNPCDLNVVLPGYITFWIKDNISNKYYESDRDYYILKKTDKKIDVNFKPLN